MFCGNNTQNRIEIKEIIIYNYSNNQGYTTSSAYSKFLEIESSNLNRIYLSIDEVKMIQTIIYDSKVKKIFLGKTGNMVLFAKLLTKDNKEFKILFTPNLIRDFTNKKDYWIKNQQYNDWFSTFQK